MSKNIESNIWKLFVIKGLRWFLVAMPIIILFFQETGLSLFEIMILQSTYSIVVACMEIPSGFFADILGRKKSLIVGGFLSFFGFLIISTSFDFWQFMIAQLLLGIGQSFISGSDSALLYDTLISTNKTDIYDKIEGKSYGIGNFSESIAGILGGFLAASSLRLPWYVQTGVAFLVIPFAFSLVEPQLNLKSKIERSFKSIIKIVKFSLFDNRKLRGLIFLSSSIGMATLSAAWFAQPYFSLIDLPIKWFGIIWAILNVTAGFSSVNSYRLTSVVSHKTKLYLVSIIIGVSFIILSFIESYFGLIFLILIYIMRGLVTPSLYELINNETVSEIRATVLSVRSFFIRMSFAITAPIIGWITDHGTLGNGLFILGSITAIFSCIILWKLDLTNK
jgi:MFS family permease